VAQVAEHLPSKHETLNSNPENAKNNCDNIGIIDILDNKTIVLDIS
jgi:hypothetical protein